MLAHSQAQLCRLSRQAPGSGRGRRGSAAFAVEESDRRSALARTDLVLREGLYTRSLCPSPCWGCEQGSQGHGTCSSLYCCISPSTSAPPLPSLCAPIPELMHRLGSHSAPALTPGPAVWCSTGQGPRTLSDGPLPQYPPFPFAVPWALLCTSLPCPCFVRARGHWEEAAMLESV